MTTIVTRAGKGSPLTHTEVDTNFTNLNTNKLEAGAIALGSAATPSISFTGDTNTGIYSPGADQVAVATNGTQKLIVLSNGNVGIGTSSPTEAVLVVNNSNGSTDNGITGNTIFVKAATFNSNLVRFSGAVSTDLLVGRFGATDNISIGTTGGTTIATFKSDGK